MMTKKTRVLCSTRLCYNFKRPNTINDDVKNASQSQRPSIMFNLKVRKPYV